MWPESKDDNQPLKTGLTTGTCATACTVAAATAIFATAQAERVFVTLPKGQEVSLTVNTYDASDPSAQAATLKDAEDDPDVTNGARV